MRQKAYWLKQAYAIRRQMISLIAHAVCMGMADGKDRQKALDELELTETTEVSKQKDSQATWDMLYFMKAGKSV